MFQLLYVQVKQLIDIMAASVLDADQLRKVLECSICLEQYDKPKMLKCTHYNCTHCLEDILVFHNDGSATIACPLRCDEGTVLNHHQTVNDLATSYVVKQLLDILQASACDANAHVCSMKEQCGKKVVVFCCTDMMCNSCYLSHFEDSRSEIDHRKFRLEFDQRRNKFVIVCDEHASRCSHLCVDDKFLCLYCLQRDIKHKPHAKNTIETEVKLLRGALQNEIDDTQKKWMNIVHSTREELKTQLTQRKEECLSAYETVLEKEAMKIVEHFEFMNQVNVFESSGLDLTYYQQMLLKLETELVLRKHEVLQEITQHRRNLAQLKGINVSMSEEFDYRSDNPLGEVFQVIFQSLN
jgi:hypothetical protein